MYRVKSTSSSSSSAAFTNQRRVTGLHTPTSALHNTKHIQPGFLKESTRYYRTYTQHLPTRLASTPPTPLQHHRWNARSTLLTNPVSSALIPYERSSHRSFSTAVDKNVSDKEKNPQPTAKDKSLLVRTKEWTSKAKETTKAALLHYWAGTKLFVFETKTSLKLLMRIYRGHTLSRRESRQLSRTIRDLFRLIPFVIIVVVPFLEFALPVLLKIFPNMLPSTFEDKLKKEENLKRKLKGKIELAKFLQDTLEDSAKEKQIKASGQNFSEFLRKVRSGEAVSNEELLRFSKIFEDDLTLDNLSRPQLVAMCKYIDLPPYGPDTLLRFLLTQRLKQIKDDDQLIQSEGIDNLTLEELQSALRARGMGATGLGHMKKRLRDWLELSLDHNLPASLLLLSRTFLITQSAKTEELLKDTIASLPEELIGEVQLKIEKDVTPDVKLEILQRQNEIMNAEREEKERKQKEEQITKVQPSSDTKKEEEKIKEKLKEISEAVQILSAPSPVEKERAELQELKAEREKLEKEKKGQEARDKVEKQEKEKVEMAQKEQIKIQEAQEKEDRALREEALKNTSEEEEATKMAEQNRILEEKAKKEQEERAKKDLEAKLKKEQEDKAQKKAEAKEAKLEALLDNIIKKLEKEVDKVEKTVGTKLHVIDTDKDGVISTTELQQAAGLLKEKLSEDDIKTIITKIDRDHDGRISLTELLQFASEQFPKSSTATATTVTTPVPPTASPTPITTSATSQTPTPTATPAPSTATTPSVPPTVASSPAPEPTSSPTSTSTTTTSASATSTRNST